MFKFFNKKRNEFNYAIELNGNINYIRKRYEEQMTIAIDRYSNSEFFVKNNHILSRILNFGMISTELDEYTYLNLIMNNVDNVARHFNITFNSCIGKIYNSIFYGANSYESFIHIKNKGNYFKLKDIYTTYNSIRCVYNEDSDIDFYYPRGTKDFNIPKLFIYEIDLTGLFMQYYYWCHYRTSIGKNTSVNIFVTRIVLTNMMPSILDWNLFNRYLNFAKSIPEEPIKNRNHFPIIDLSKKVNLLIDGVIDKISNHNLVLDNILKHIPLVFEENSKDLLQYELVYTSVQSEWLLVLGRIKIILDLLNIMGDKGMDSNKDMISDLRVNFRYLKNKHIKLENINIPIIKEDIEYTLNEIKKIIGYTD